MASEDTPDYDRKEAVIVKVNGQSYNLSKGSDGIWTTTITAPTQTSGSNNTGKGPGVGAEAVNKGYYPVLVRAEDTYGNITTADDSDSKWGNVLRLKVLEKEPPSMTILYPTNGAHIKSSRPTFRFKVQDGKSGPNGSQCFIKIDQGEPVRVTGVVDGVVCVAEYTPSSNIGDGEHTVTVYGYDYDGNRAQNNIATFNIDTTPPALNITLPSRDSLLTNKTSVLVRGTTNDEVSSPVTIKITGGVETYTPAVVNGEFEQMVALRDNAVNKLVITATDSAGLITTVNRTVTVKTKGTEITSIELVPNPVDGGKTFTIKVTVSNQ